MSRSSFEGNVAWTLRLGSMFCIFGLPSPVVCNVANLLPIWAISLLVFCRESGGRLSFCFIGCLAWWIWLSPIWKFECVELWDLNALPWKRIGLCCQVLILSLFHRSGRPFLFFAGSLPFDTISILVILHRVTMLPSDSIWHGFKTSFPFLFLLLKWFQIGRMTCRGQCLRLTLGVRSMSGLDC